MILEVRDVAHDVRQDITGDLRGARGGVRNHSADLSGDSHQIEVAKPIDRGNGKACADCRLREIPYADASDQNVLTRHGRGPGDLLCPFSILPSRARGAQDPAVLEHAQA